MSDIDAVVKPVQAGELIDENSILTQFLMRRKPLYKHFALHYVVQKTHICIQVMHVFFVDLFLFCFVSQALQSDLVHSKHSTTIGWSNIKCTTGIVKQTP